jgi:hypothetical protein
MPWSGGSFTRTNGVHTGSTLWVQDRDAGTKILATRHDTHDQDLADGINDTLEKSGSNAATGNLDIGSNRLTLVADGTAKTDAATVNQIQSNGPAFQATDTGTANAYVVALSPAVTAYAAGQAITFKAAAASTTASTLNVNTLGTKAIKKQNDQDIASGDIESGSIVTVVYDGTSFQMTSQLASASTTSPGGSDTQVQYNSSSAFAGSANFTFDGTSATVANPLYLPDGAVSAPALSNTGDSDTGIYFSAANELSIATQGVQRAVFDADGNITHPTQCAVSAIQAGAVANVTGDGTAYTFTYTTELFDQNADFDGTSTFTAPVTGRYFVSVRAQWDSLTSSNTAANHALISSNRTYSAIYQDAGATQVGGSLRVAYSMFVDMDASDTFTTTGGVSGTTAVVDVGGQATPTVQLSVYLAA